MNRILLTAELLFISICLALLIACEDVVEPMNLDGLSALSIRPYQDTLFFSSESEPYDLSLKGSFIKEYENIVSMGGVMETSTFTFISYDTTTKDVPNAQAAWVSSNPAVASVDEGRITPRAAGVTRIYAEANGITSTSVQIKVKDQLYAPSLSLDRPLNQIVFSNIGNVSGFIQDGSILLINDIEFGYTQEGKFIQTVGGFSQGINTVLVKAVNPYDSTLFSSQTKTFYYYPLGYDPVAPENSIIGEWEGKLDNLYPFELEITESDIPGRFDVEGTLTFEFSGVFYVEDIALTGAISEDGKIVTELSHTAENYTVEGDLSGVFSTLGTAEGEYTAELIKPGFPKIAFPGKWEATKK